MKETYELIEAKGTNGEIDFASIAIHFEKDGEAVTNYSAGPLNASIPSDSDHDVIIHCALNAIGYGELQKIRESAKERLSQTKNSSEVYYKAEDDRVHRLYVRLALIEANLWKQVQKHFQNEKRTDVEITYFEESPVWSKTHPIFAKAISKFDNETIDAVFKRAKELSRITNVSDVFV
jgi:hypothetical protein